MQEKLSMRALALSVALAAAFFHITAATFASLGVVLPKMIETFGWRWSTAGLGFTMLALMTGVFSPVAATSLERLGARRHYALGGALAAAGFVMLANTSGVASYLAATSLLGAAFALLANVPGTYIVARAVSEARRPIAIGLYLAAGGLGGVAGPLIANAMLTGNEDWRAYWRTAAIVIALIAALIVLLTEKTSAEPAAEPSASEDLPESRWRPREAIRTRAFMTIAAALAVAYFCGVTVSTWSVSHLEHRGFAASFAVAMFSLYSGVNAAARAAGGALARKISAKTLLVSALLANVVGMTALALASSPALALVFALFDGFAFGMALFATTALLIGYFGLKNSPALLGAVNLAATVAMLGPTIAGAAADRTGGFAPVFIVYAIAALIAAIAVSLMRAPSNAHPQ